MKKKNPIDQILDENNSENIVFYSENGKQIEFEQIAVIPLDETIYVILHPADPMPEIAEDEALVFAIAREYGEEVLKLVEDFSIVDRVFDEYYALLDAEGGADS